MSEVRENHENIEYYKYSVITWLNSIFFYLFLASDVNG